MDRSSRWQEQYISGEPTAPLEAPEHAETVAAAKVFVETIAAIDRRLRKGRETVPSKETKEEATRAFWSFVEVMNRAASNGAGRETRAACLELLGPWLFRSSYWSRAYHKPHGFPGDYRMVEWMYDIEGQRFADPTQPGILNCLDHLFGSVHSVVSVWQRRRWFGKMLAEERRKRDGTLRILDVAAGGARYLRDFLVCAPDTSRIEITVVDQDAAAIAFCRMHSLAPWLQQVQTVCGPISQLPALVPRGGFHVIISAGLWDYLDDRTASNLAGHLGSLLAAGGLLAISNFHPSDPSRYVKDWLVDWPLTFRDEEQCAALFPASLKGRTGRSENRALTYAWAMAR